MSRLSLSAVCSLENFRTAVRKLVKKHYSNIGTCFRKDRNANAVFLKIKTLNLVGLCYLFDIFLVKCCWYVLLLSFLDFST